MPAKLTKETFIERSNKKHNNKYDYSKVVYINSTTKVTIICPIHGKFSQTPAVHMKAELGCKKCANESTGNRCRDTFKLFKEKAEGIHKNKYDYSKVIYKHAGSKVTIVCPEHGEFKQAPSMHISGQGCPKCGRIRTEAARRLTKNKFIEKAIKIHGDAYTYSKVEYINNSTKVNILCNGCNTYFLQSPDDHMGGHGCPTCCKYSIKLDKPVTFYILKLSYDTPIYKIGITNKDVKTRYQSDNPNKIIDEVLLEISFLDGYDVVLLEKEVKNKFHQNLFTDDVKLFGKTKNTEIFTTNPLKFVVQQLTSQTQK